MNCIEEYVAYLKDNPEGYWFKRKLYGFGWTPAKREGWIVLGLYLAFVLGLIFFVPVELREVKPIINIVLPVLIATLIFIIIAYRTGESLKWQWGNKSDYDQSK
ncbi:hypothetical protein H6784_04425 [Candidatus Nomurabacteria bacterium]|nr:hypothetical protein [Candidatus Kaiserbacteria bacterium]MCB9814633.1 hypothetical protein [Candidatus Nomurabacteria bacterium]